MIIKKVTYAVKVAENPLGNFSTAQRKNEKCVKKSRRGAKQERKEDSSRDHFLAELRFHLVGSKI